MKAFYRILLVSAAVVLTSCGSDEVMKIESDTDGTAQYITIRLSDIRSRSGRELHDAEAGQDIDNVKIIIIDNGDKVVWTKLLDKWNTSDATAGSILSDDKTFREAKIEIPKTECRLINGDVYHAYAYGYTNADASDYDLSPIESLTVDSEYASNIHLTLKDGKIGEELFAGDCQLIGNADGFEADLVLNRQVAGAFGYLTNIPYVCDPSGHVGSYLILTVSNPQKRLVLGEFDNSAGIDYKGKNVINGQTANETNVVYTIALHEWFKNIVEAKDENGKGNSLIECGDNWTGDAQLYQNGSVYGGNFLIPTSKTIGTATFQLALCYENDLSTAMRVWSVTLPETASQLSEYSLLRYANGTWTTENAKDEIAEYNVLRNRLYGIGVKAAGELNAGTPDNPDDDPEDKPIDLNNKQVLTLTVNGEWNWIYNMGVE